MRIYKKECGNSIKKDIKTDCEENGEHRNKPAHIWSNDFHQRCQNHETGKRLSFQQKVLGKLNIHMKLGPYCTPHTKILN